MISRCLIQGKMTDSKRGAALIEFVFCAPVICLFLYGVIYINSYFDKEERTAVLLRSTIFSSNLEQSNKIYENDFEFKKETISDESRLFEDKVDYQQHEHTDLGEDISTIISSFGIGKLGEELLKLQDNRMEETSITSTRKEEDDTKLEGMAYKYLRLNLSSKISLSKRMFSLLDTGYLEDSNYKKLAIIYWVLGLGSSWGSNYIDECLMNFKMHNVCNGGNALWATIGIIVAAKAPEEISTWGAGAVIEDIAAEAIDEIIDSIIGSVVDKSMDYLENTVLNGTFSD